MTSKDVVKRYVLRVWHSDDAGLGGEGWAVRMSDHFSLSETIQKWVKSADYEALTQRFEQVRQRVTELEGLPSEMSAVEKVCCWEPIEYGSLTYEPGCCREWWTKDEPGVELYPHCHWCGGKIEEVSEDEDSPVKPPGDTP